MGLSIRAAPWTVIQNNQGDPLQLVVQESENEDFELVLELDSHNVFSQSGAGKRKNKRYVCFGKYALDRTLAITMLTYSLNQVSGGNIGRSNYYIAGGGI